MPSSRLHASRAAYSQSTIDRICDKHLFLSLASQGFMRSGRLLILVLTLPCVVIACGSDQPVEAEVSEPAAVANFEVRREPVTDPHDAAAQPSTSDAEAVDRRADQDLEFTPIDDTPPVDGLTPPVEGGGTDAFFDGGSTEEETGPSPDPCAELIATISADHLQGHLPLSVTFNASTSCGPAPLDSFVWTFGEDEPTQWGEEAQFTFLSSGEHLVTLTLTDTAGEASATTLAITVFEGLCPQGDEAITTGNLPFNELQGASGLAASLTEPEVLWTLGDSGAPATLFATTSSGQALGSFPLEGAENIDWEDITIAQGAQGEASRLFVWDGGDNQGRRESVQVLIVDEPPLALMTASPPPKLTWTAMTLTYPEGISANSDSLLFDPQSGDLLIVAKETDADTSRVFRKAAPHLPESTTTLSWVTDLDFGEAPLQGASYPTGGAFSPLGDRIMLRTDDSAFLWLRDGAQSLTESLSAPPCPGPFAVQAEGESISFDSTGEGYFDVADATQGEIRYVPFVEPDVCTPPETQIVVAPAAPHYAPATLTFSATADCMLGDISAITWTIDGVVTESLSPTLTFEKPGSVSVSLSAEDTAGGIANATTTLEILEAPCALVSPTETWASVEESAIDEASGVVMSSEHDGVLWVHNDSGDTPRMFALNSDGALLGIWSLSTVAKDWEDLAYGYDEALGTHALYIGDVGDNASARPDITVHIVPEPLVNQDTEAGTQSIENFSSMTLTYPEGVAHNCETVMRDPLTGDLYLVVKSGDGKSPVFRKAAPHTDGSEVELEWVADLVFGSAPLSGSASTTAGAFSPNGDKILIRTYSHAYMWTRSDGQSVAEALSGPPCDVHAPDEPQGEAICFSADGAGYITISEGSHQPIYYTGLD